MDLLLADIRPAAPEQTPPGKLAEANVPEFAALLRNLPENAAGSLSRETLSIPAEQAGVDNKSLKISILPTELVARDGFIDEPAGALTAIVAALREPAPSAPSASVVTAEPPPLPLAPALSAGETSGQPTRDGETLPAGGSLLPPVSVAPPAAALTSAPADFVPAHTALSSGQAGSVAVDERTSSNSRGIGLNLPAIRAGHGEAAPGVPSESLSRPLNEAGIGSRAIPRVSADSPVPPSAASDAARMAVELPDAARLTQSQATPVAMGLRDADSLSAERLQRDIAPIVQARETAGPVAAVKAESTADSDLAGLQRAVAMTEEIRGAVSTPRREADGVNPPVADVASARTPLTDPALRASIESTDPLRGAIARADTDAGTDAQLLSRDAAFVRGSDLPSGSNSTPAQTPAMVSAPTFPLQSGWPQAAVPTGVLPPQLEALSIARDAPATEWGDGIGERVSWLINQKQNAALIRLDPPALGRLEVQIRVTDDATTITIQTQLGQTRDLIEAGAPRLREYLQEAGFQNVNVDVSQRQDQQQAATGQQPEFEIVDDRESDGLESGSDWIRGEGSAAYHSDNLVDTFA